MPYILPHLRETLRPQSQDRARTAGELNFQITDLISKYVCNEGLNYSTINDVLGALDGAGREFYQRVASPYEYKKMRENGDVYPKELL